jgi:hypothetical protein
MVAIVLTLIPSIVRASNQEEPLMQAIPDGSTMQVTKDGRFIYVVAPTGNGQKVMITNGQVGQPYDEIGPAVFQSTPQNVRMVYAAKSGNKCFYVDQGAPGDAYDDVGPAYLGPDTRQLFYTGLLNNVWHPIVDGEIGAAADDIGTPTFSPNGKRMAYPVKNNGVWNLIDDNVQDPPCDGIGTIVYSPNSTRMAYDSIQAGKHVVVIDGRAGPAFDNIQAGTPFFTTDNIRCVYCGQKDGKWSYVVNNIVQPLGPYDDMSIPMFKSDNKHFMFVATVGNAQMVVYDGSPQQSYDAIAPESLHFNPDITNTNGTQYIYVATDKGKKIAILGAVPGGPPYDTIAPTTYNFTPKGDATYYWAQDMGQWLWRNDRHTVANYDDYKVGPAIYAPDSKRTMYAVKTPATNGKWQVMIDGNPLPAFFDDIDETQMKFTPDARHTIFVAKTGNAWNVFVDGVPGPNYIEIVSGGGPVIQPDGSIIYYSVGANGSLNRVTFRY